MSAKGTIRILLVDDHPMILEGIASRLAGVEHFEVVGTAGDGLQAVQLVEELEPDIVVTDISMPVMTGLEAIKVVRRTHPKVQFVVLTMYDDAKFVREIAAAGVNGYVLKNTAPADLVRAIETVHQGGTFFEHVASMVLLEDYSRAAAEPADDEPPLSAREREVLALIASGRSNKEIASQLHVSVSTVQTHRERIIKKLNIHTVAGLTRYAIANGLAEL